MKKEETPGRAESTGDRTQKPDPSEAPSSEDRTSPPPATPGAISRIGASSSARLDAPSRALAAKLSAIRERRARTDRDAPAERSARSQPPKRFDFRSPLLLSDDQIKSLAKRHQALAEVATRNLSIWVGTPVAVEFTALRQCTYFDFIRPLRTPTYLQIAHTSAGRLPLIAEVTPAILFPLIHGILGGEAGDAAYPIRPLTELERALAAKVTRRVFDALTELWREVVPEAAFELGRTEHNPLQLRGFDSTEPAVVVSLHAAVGPDQGAIQLCFPTKRFAGLLAELARGPSIEAEAPARDATFERLAKTTVDVAALLPPVSIALEDIAALRPGDVIATGVATDAELDVTIAGRSVLRANLDSSDRLEVRGPR